MTLPTCLNVKFGRESYCAEFVRVEVSLETCNVEIVSVVGNGGA